MAWSDAARTAALEARKRKRRARVYEPPQASGKGYGTHVLRREMASRIRKARKSTTGFKSVGERNEAAVTHATAGRYYTNVRYAKDASQGLSGSVSPNRKTFGYRRWSAKGYS